MTDYAYSFLVPEQHFFVMQTIRNQIKSLKRKAKTYFAAADGVLIEEVILSTGGFIE